MTATNIRTTRATRTTDNVTITTPYSAVTIKFDSNVKMLDQLRAKYRTAQRKGQSDHYLLTLQTAGEFIKSHMEPVKSPIKPREPEDVSGYSKSDLFNLLYKEYDLDLDTYSITKAALIDIYTALVNK